MNPSTPDVAALPGGCRTPAEPAVRPERLIVIADHSRGAHRTDSDEADWWLPVLGPTATVIARTLARHARDGCTEWNTADLARRIGLSGNRSTLWTSLERLHRFRCATFLSVDVITIRLELPALTPSQRRLLPDDMADHYGSGRPTPT